MADEENVEVEAEEELDIDSLLDDVAAGGSEEEETEELDVDALLDDVAADEPNEEEELDVDALLDDVAAEEPETATAAEESAEEDFDVDALMDDVAAGEVGGFDNATEPEPAPAPEPEPAPVAAAVPSAEFEQLLIKLTAVAERVESSVAKGESVNVELEERLVAGERMVKGIRDVSKEMKEERPSLVKVEKSSSMTMIAGGVTLLLSAAVLGLIVTEDKEAATETLDGVFETVEGVHENVNLIAGRLLEQQQQMDEAMDMMDFLKTAAAKPVVDSENEDEMETAAEEGEEEVKEIAVDFSVVEGKIDETQQKILALHEQLKSTEGRYPELKKHLEQLVVGQKQLKIEQVKLLRIQQQMSDKEKKGQTIYKFP